MNTAIVQTQTHLASRSPPPLSDAAVLASLPLDSKKRVVFSDLSYRWERIVLGDRA